MKLTSIFQNSVRAATNTGAKTALRNADAARDDRNWAKAAELYKEYLASAPDHDAIWVQFGHMLKESGNLSGGRGGLQAQHRAESGNRGHASPAWSLVQEVAQDRRGGPCLQESAAA